jgi:hypothetical protein
MATQSRQSMGMEGTPPSHRTNVRELTPSNWIIWIIELIRY